MFSTVCTSGLGYVNSTSGTEAAPDFHNENKMQGDMQKCVKSYQMAAKVGGIK